MKLKIPRRKTEVLKKGDEYFIFDTDDDGRMKLIAGRKLHSTTSEVVLIALQKYGFEWA